MEAVQEKLKSALDTANAAMSLANHNQQYSQKNNIKILNWKEPKRSESSKELKDKFIKVMAEAGVTVTKDDILAMHRVPSQKSGPRPVIMKFLRSEKRQEVIVKRQEVMESFVMIDHVTTRNLDLINRLRDCEGIDSAWYFNCNIYALDAIGHKHKFDIGNDNVEEKLKDIQANVKAHQRAKKNK